MLLCQTLCQHTVIWRVKTVNASAGVEFLPQQCLSAEAEIVVEGLKSATKQKILNKIYSTEIKEIKKLCHQWILQHSEDFQSSAAGSYW